MKNKPKLNRKFNPKIIEKSDLFLSPFGSIDLIVPYLPRRSTVYDPCCGDNKYKMILDRLQQHGFTVVGSDLRLEPFIDIFDVKEKYSEYLDKSDTIVLNPFFSGKKKIYELLRFDWQKPFAMLLPTDDSMWLLKSIRDDGCKWIKPLSRINYITPDIVSRINKYFSMDYNSIFDIDNDILSNFTASQFHSGWLTWGLNVPEKLTIVDFTKEQQTNMIRKLKTIV